MCCWLFGCGWGFRNCDLEKVGDWNGHAVVEREHRVALVEGNARDRARGFLADRHGRTHVVGGRDRDLIGAGRLDVARVAAAVPRDLRETRLATAELHRADGLARLVANRDGRV